MECERCSKRTPPDSFMLHDYCATCSKNLCDDCMAKGCCGSKPAKSGQADDYGDDHPGGDCSSPAVGDLGG